MSNQQDWNGQQIAEFRANGGVTRRFGDRLILLHTVGARTGESRITPVASTRGENGEIVIIASKGGADTHPHWYHNILSQPRVTVELGAESFPAVARVAVGEERRRLYEAQAAVMPGFAEYQARTRREIPVVVLERAD